MKSKKTLKLSVFILILAVTLVFPGINSFASGLILGDMNNDGMVDSNDAIHLLRHTLSPIKYPISQSGNINGTDGVNSDDAIYLLRHTMKPDEYPILSCAHEFVSYEAQAATCTEVGWDAYTACSKCNYNNYKETPALGHDLTSYPAQEASCTAIGWNAYEKCSRCDYSTYEEQDILPHNYVDDICVDCSNPYISSNGFHAHKNKVSDPVASTCTVAGHSESIVCTDCGKTLVKQTALPLLPHDYVNGVCTVCGNTPVESTGLAFISDGLENYMVSGIGECTDTQIVIPSTYNGASVVGISSDAFVGNTDIVQIVIPSSVKKIGSNAFKRCTGLVDVVFNEGLETIGASAFMYCTALRSVDIPDSVKTIYTAAFIACYDLEEVTIGSGISKIYNDVFFECYSMKTLTVNAKLSSIGGWSLYDCDSLTAINYVGTDTEWEAISFGDYWDEYSGDYTVYCSNGTTVHKHIYGEWYDTGVECEAARDCTVCSYVHTKFKHTVSDSSWVFTSESISQLCSVCGNHVNTMVMDETILSLDFDQKVSEELQAYPYFTLVSDGSNIYELQEDRSVWAVNSTTWIDYNKLAFENIDYYIISFDTMVTAKPAYTSSNTSGARDNSVFSFVPGNNGGIKVGTSNDYLWQLKYVPLLDKLASLQLNGTGVNFKYTSADEIPEDVLATFNESTSADFGLNEWATVTIICNSIAKESYIFVNETYIGERTIPDHSNTNYGDAFSIRFVDNPAFGTKIDNFKIQGLYPAN